MEKSGTLAGLLLGLAFPAMATEPPAEPPIVEVESEVTGETIRTQTWETGKREVALTSFGSAASRYYGWRDMPAIDQGLLRGRLECPVDRYGKAVVEPLKCKMSCPDFPTFGCANLLERLVPRSAFAFDPLPEISERQARRVQRRVAVEFDVDPALQPTLDFGTGDLLEASAVVERMASMPNYPPRALRQEAEGVMTILCKVHHDLSVSCLAESFDPPEHLGLFSDLARQIGFAMDVKATTDDGVLTAGKRFRFPLRFVIPE